jgi:hypothetical protein
MKRLSRKPSNLSEFLHKRLNSYALAASAAGVGILVLAPTAEAEIVYTHANVVIGHGGLHLYKLDLNHDGTIDFRIHSSIKSSATTHRSFYRVNLFANPSGNNGVEGTSGGIASSLSAGERIGPRRRFGGNWIAGISNQNATSTTSGGWCNVGAKYLGLKFRFGDQTHYGWARLDVACTFHRGTHPAITATLTGYAYETVSNKPIIAGKTKGPDVVTVQPASLGALAAGALKVRSK